MNTVQLECFLAVAEYLNFSKAAETVKITQPAVSRQIQTLEDELGVKLFVRTSKHVRLTRAGMQFLNDATSILRISQTAKSRLEEFKNRELLFFGIGCFNRCEMEFLPPVLRQMSREMPLLRPSIKLLPFQAMENLLETESIQVMFSLKKALQKKAGRVYMELMKCPIVCVCARDHPLAARETLTEEDLAGNMVLCEPRKVPEIILRIQNRVSLNRPASQLIFGDGYESMLALVKAGLGFSLIPDLFPVREPGLCHIPVAGFESVGFGVYYKSGKGNDVLTRFLQLLKEKTAMAPSKESAGV